MACLRVSKRYDMLLRCGFSRHAKQCMHALERSSWADQSIPTRMDQKSRFWSVQERPREDISVELMHHFSGVFPSMLSLSYWSQSWPILGNTSTHTEMGDPLSITSLSHRDSDTRAQRVEEAVRAITRRPRPSQRSGKHAR